MVNCVPQFILGMEPGLIKVGFYQIRPWLVAALCNLTEIILLVSYKSEATYDFGIYR